MTLAQGAYRRSARPVATADATPHEIVSTTLRQLLRSLNALSAAQSQGLPYPSDVLNRAITAIFVLQSSLDFERGGSIAPQLFQLYEFCRHHVLKAWKNDETARLAEAAFTISEILEAWEGIAEAERKAP